MTTETNHALQNAQGWMETIHNFIIAMDEESWERREELQDRVTDEETNLSDFRKAEASDLALTSDEVEELQGLNAALAEYEDVDDARTQAEESALSVELSGTWEPGAKPEADSYIILLSTGGPALRITGNLGRYNEPSSASLEYQDWGTPWTEYREANENDLLQFASVFYFGE